MNYKLIRMQHVNSTPNCRLIRELCDELIRRDRVENIRVHGYRQIIRALQAKIWMLEDRKKREAA